MGFWCSLSVLLVVAGGLCVYREVVKDVSNVQLRAIHPAQRPQKPPSVCAQQEPRQTWDTTFSPVHILWFHLRQAANSRILNSITHIYSVLKDDNGRSYSLGKRLHNRTSMIPVKLYLTLTPVTILPVLQLKNK